MSRCPTCGDSKHVVESVVVKLDSKASVQDMTRDIELAADRAISPRKPPRGDESPIRFSTRAFGRAATL